MNPIKDWLKARLRKGLALPALEENIKDRLAALEENIKDRLAHIDLFGVSYWYEGNLWEPPVQIALRDLCKPGSVVFDVGANFGGLTIVMSRMVGPRGIVCAFEASPRIVNKCQRNLILNGCSNVQVYHTAVYHTSHKQVPIYLGSHLVDDSIYTSSNTDAPAFRVPTLAIDDFVEFTGLVPNLVKMDIEGAEFDAIMGMVNTISHVKPYMILETQPNDTRCLDLLKESGYVAIDLNTYREVRSPDDYPEGVAVRNNLYVHRSRLSESPYQPPFTLVQTAILRQDEFSISNKGSVVSKTTIALDRGRYLIIVDFSADGIDNEMMCGVKVGETVIFRYHAYTRLLAQNYKDWVINLTEASEIKLYFEFLKNTDDNTFSVRGAKVFRVVEFDKLSSWLPI